MSRMNPKRRTISVSTETWVDVDVDLGIDEIIDQIDRDTAMEIAQRHQLLGSSLGPGDGDSSRLRSIVDEAERELRRMAQIPRALADLMYHVHGRAIA